MEKLIQKEDKIFLAGHNGMVGRAIFRELNNSGYKNIIVVSRNVLDLTDTSSVRNWFDLNKPDVTIIAAAKVGGIVANNSYPADFLLENLKIQNNIIENSFHSKVKRLLFLGSSCIYPKFSNQPIYEDDLLTGSLEPTNQWYALAKIAGIKLCESLNRQFGFDAISLMPSNLYGSGDYYHKENSHVIPALIRKFDQAKMADSPSVTCWGSGSPKREFLYVDDLARACVFALEKWNPNLKNAPKNNLGEPLYFLNVGSGVDISIYDLAYLISEIIGFKGEILWDKTKPDGTPKKLLNIERIKKIGWIPKISLKKGLMKTIDCYHDEKNKNKLRL